LAWNRKYWPNTLLLSGSFCHCSDESIHEINSVSLVDEITYKKAAEAADTVTQSAILGPFFRHDAPKREKNDSIIFDTPKDGQVVYMHGHVLNAKDKKPLSYASVDVWQASTNGTCCFLCSEPLLNAVQVCMSNKTPASKTAICEHNFKLMKTASMHFIV
jgi:Dioxygenase